MDGRCYHIGTAAVELAVTMRVFFLTAYIYSALREAQLDASADISLMRSSATYICLQDRLVTEPWINIPYWKIQYKGCGDQNVN